MKCLTLTDRVCIEGIWNVYSNESECGLLQTDYLRCTKRIRLYCKISALLQHKQIICGAKREYVSSVCYAHYYSTNRKPLVHKENPFLVYTVWITTVQTESLWCIKRIGFYCVLQYSTNGGKAQKIALKCVELSRSCPQQYVSLIFMKLSNRKVVAPL